MGKARTVLEFISFLIVGLVFCGFARFPASQPRKSQKQKLLYAPPLGGKKRQAGFVSHQQKKLLEAVCAPAGSLDSERREDTRDTHVTHTVTPTKHLGVNCTIKSSLTKFSILPLDVWFGLVGVAWHMRATCAKKGGR